MQIDLRRDAADIDRDMNKCNYPEERFTTARLINKPDKFQK